MTNFNQRTNTLLYKNISLTFYSRKGWCWLRVRGELATETDCYILTQSSSNHGSTSFPFWLGCSILGHWGPKPSVWSWFSLRWNPISNSLQTGTDPSRLWHLVIFLFDVYLLPLFSAYLHRCISWLTARSKVNIQHWPNVVVAVRVRSMGQIDIFKNMKII